MTIKWQPTFVLCALGALLFPALAAAPEKPTPAEARVVIAERSPAMTGVDLEQLAAKLVNDCAGIRAGEIVAISGGVKNLELLENMTVQAARAGAFPMLTLSSERLIRRLWDDVPAQYDSVTPALDLKLAEIVDATISVNFIESERLLSHVPAARRAARAKAGEPVAAAFRTHSVRSVELGNGLYPTPALAQRSGISEEQLARIFWSGVNTDYAKLHALGESLRTTLGSGRELRVTTPLGTDLRLRVEGRPAYVSDGVISPEEAKSGGPQQQVWLPAGEVYLVPVPGTAEGRIVVERQVFDGEEIKGLELTVKAGRLESMTAQSGLPPLKALYDASSPGKELFGLIDFGINPDVTIPAGSRLLAWMPAGMVSVAFGNNGWAGGDNTSSFFMASHLPGATVFLDGKPIVEGGRLKP